MENQDHQSDVLHRLQMYLQSKNVVPRIVQHQPTMTSEESAQARGEPLEVGAKALLLKADDRFVIAVLPASMKLNSSAFKQLVGCKSLRFATREELFEKTGLVPGSLPPFGAPIFPFDLWADSRVGTHFGRVAFNAGSLTTSMILPLSDWLSLASPQLEIIATT